MSCQALAALCACVSAYSRATHLPSSFLDGSMRAVFVCITRYFDAESSALSLFCLRMRAMPTRRQCQRQRKAKRARAQVQAEVSLSAMVACPGPLSLLETVFPSAMLWPRGGSLSRERDAAQDKNSMQGMHLQTIAAMVLDLARPRAEICDRLRDFA